eukprot:CAMPEP_0119264904 /NCGR_PEP_ID=MMETSP1329-20130426/3857_1 /TAXON_ID=114041 /ORGANISM="Genus nov. species nov., Strain RCC1024" /LENGTH=168 /DNA_ID=CAMNT_0007264697 /DNA_START=138 /DNA_END=644 /DNA_ORIENTATION=+
MQTKHLVALLFSAAAALRHRSTVTPLRVARGGADDDGDALFGGDDAAAAPKMPGSLQDMMGSMPGMPPGFDPNNPAEYEAAMEQLLDSPMMQEFLQDPEKMEQSRQALLNNPMAMQMMKSMPGFEEIINDKDKFAERMLASKAQFDAMRAASKADTAAESAAASEFDD